MTISLWIEEGVAQTTDCEYGRYLSPVLALNQLRALSWQRKRYQIYLLVSDKTPATLTFIRIAGRFCPVTRRQNPQPLYAKTIFISRRTSLIRAFV